jgi:hypothetical protein
MIRSSGATAPELWSADTRRHDENTVAEGRDLAGATTVTLAAVPANWKLGDELLIPDTNTQELGPDHQKHWAKRDVGPSRRSPVPW